MSTLGSVEGRTRARYVKIPLSCSYWTQWLFLTYALNEVEEIITDEQRAEEVSVKHPPKVGRYTVTHLFEAC